jgi:hypothetical protein
MYIHGPRLVVDGSFSLLMFYFEGARATGRLGSVGEVLLKAASMMVFNREAEAVRGCSTQLELGPYLA